MQTLADNMHRLLTRRVELIAQASAARHRQALADRQQLEEKLEKADEQMADARQKDLAAVEKEREQRTANWDTMSRELLGEILDRPDGTIMVTVDAPIYRWRFYHFGDATNILGFVSYYSESEGAARRMAERLRQKGESFGEFLVPRDMKEGADVDNAVSLGTVRNWLMENPGARYGLPPEQQSAIGRPGHGTRARPPFFEERLVRPGNVAVWQAVEVAMFGDVASTKGAGRGGLDPLVSHEPGEEFRPHEPGGGQYVAAAKGIERVAHGAEEYFDGLNNVKFKAWRHRDQYYFIIEADGIPLPYQRLGAPSAVMVLRRWMDYWKPH